MGVAAAADGDVNGRQLFSCVGQAEAEAEVIDHALDIGGRIDPQRFLAAPFAVAVVSISSGSSRIRILAADQHGCADKKS